MAYEHVKEFEHRIPTKEYVTETMYTELPPLEQAEPIEAKRLHHQFRENYDKALAIYHGHRITVTGIVIFRGLDVHGIPSFELSDSAGGVCYVLCCLRSENEYGDVSVGDTAVVSGNYLTVHEKYGVVLKNCTLRRIPK